MQLSSLAYYFSFLLSATSVLADWDGNGNPTNCFTATVPQSTGRNPTCHNGQGTIVKTYPGTSLKKRVSTSVHLAKDMNHGKCSIIIYPATSYPAVTATLPPCKKNVVSDNKFINCITIGLIDPVAQPPTCHNGEGTIVKTYPGSSRKERRVTNGWAVGDSDNNHGNCKVTIYHAFSSPATTVTLTPCKKQRKTVYKNPKRPFGVSCVKKGTNPTRLARAVTVKPKTVTGKDNKVTIFRGKYFPRVIKVFPFCN